MFACNKQVQRLSAPMQARGHIPPFQLPCTPGAPAKAVIDTPPRASMPKKTSLSGSE